MRDFVAQQAVVFCGDNIEILRGMDDNSFDSIVTDPPYGLSFMGKKWDYDVPSVELWQECLRVLKPGGHLLAFAGTRTQHRMCARIEDAGFEIRDMIAWVYGSGFPKSHDVSKAIDKAFGAERNVVGIGTSAKTAGMQALGASGINGGEYYITAPVTDVAKRWQGWGTALKPALEPITVARKPFVGTVADNVLENGTAALNIDACRVGNEVVGWSGGKHRSGDAATSGASRGGNQGGFNYAGGEARPVEGRWPANLIHDGSDDVVRYFQGKNDKSAARFFYCAKASKKDRDGGLDGFQERPHYTEAHAKPNRDGRENVTRANHHPTVKPTDLMRYLCRLVTPPGGIVLDPFTGSGSTGKAAVLEGFSFIGLEREREYVDIAEARIAHALKDGGADHER